MLLWLAACVSLYALWRIKGRHNPWPRRFLRGVGLIAGLRTRNANISVGPGVLLLSNHVSWLDIPALAGLTGTAFVAHDGLASNPVLRWLCECNDTVFIARHDRASVARQVEQVREAIRDTGALTVFPEGTTTSGVEIGAFKSSLVSAVSPLPPGIEVHPVWLDYGPDAGEIAWIGEETGAANFLRLLARRKPIVLNVHILPPLSGEALRDRKAIAKAARDAIAAARALVSVRPTQRVAL